MELVGEQLINAPRPQVWAAINDPDILLRCIPGCEEVSLVSSTERNARVMLKIGPVRARFSGRILMSDIVEPSGCRMSFEGAGGAAGFARGQSDVALVDEGAQTRLRYTVSASVGGKLGQIGGRLIDASARKVADEFFTALDAALTRDNADGGDPLVAPEPALRALEVPGAAAVTHAQADAGCHAVGPLPGLQTQTLMRTALTAELSRVLWFSLGVGTTLLVMHFVR